MSYEFQKRYYFWLFFLFLACQPDDLIEQDLYTDYFSKTEQDIVNSFDFTLSKEGTYTLTILDQSEEVVTREKFNGVVGKNTKHIHTELLPKGGLYLVLQDETKTEISKVKLNN